MLLNLQAGREPLAPYADPLSPPKRRHLVADVTRLARFYKAPLRPPQPARPDPTLPLCIATLLDEEETPHDEFRAAVFQALWEEQRDVADKATVASCLGALPEDLIERASTPTVLDQLIANSEAAYRRGVFGVPSFMRGEEVFFGADRLDLLVASLGWR
jgi:2-hydroxychromene-2-carboxylate isomerase